MRADLCRDSQLRSFIRGEFTQTKPQMSLGFTASITGSRVEVAHTQFIGATNRIDRRPFTVGLRCAIVDEQAEESTHAEHGQFDVGIAEIACLECVVGHLSRVSAQVTLALRYNGSQTAAIAVPTGILDAVYSG